MQYEEVSLLQPSSAAEHTTMLVDTSALLTYATEERHQAEHVSRTNNIKHAKHFCTIQRALMPDTTLPTP